MKTILIVDDNLTNLKLFRIILKSIHCDVIEAIDGFEAIEKTKQYHPDLILMDIQLPKINGIEALNIIKNTKDCASIPIVAVTSYAIKGDREQLMNMGFSDYLSKPIDKNTFIESIRKLIGTE